jgi:hypothetical protein
MSRSLCYAVIACSMFFTLPAVADDLVASETADSTQFAIERALSFIDSDTVTWRTDNECATCHHGTMTVWVHAEAISQGYSLDEAVVSDTLTWTKTRFLEKVDQPRDERPGWSMVSTPNIYLATMARCIPDQSALSQDEMRRIGGHFLRHQEEDGSWAWSSAPAQNRPPPVFESDEVATLLTSMALEPQLAWDGVDAAAITASLDKSAAWLAQTSPNDTTQADLLRLMRVVWSGAPADEIDAAVNHIISLQHEDGGWGQIPGASSDAYATGQALYFLSLAGVPSNAEEIHDAVAFLIATQNENGSWPMTSRSHPDATPYTNPVPITYFGSAWGTLGLLRAAGSLKGDSP